MKLTLTILLSAAALSAQTLHGNTGHRGQAFFARSRTNFLPTSSTDFTTGGYWHFRNITAHASAVAAPDGSLAQVIDCAPPSDGNTTGHHMYNSDQLLLPSNLHTNSLSFSIYLKAGATNYADLALTAHLETGDGFGNTYYTVEARVDILNGTVLVAPGGGGTLLTIDPVGNSWFRVGVSITAQLPHQRFIAASPQLTVMGPAQQLSFTDSTTAAMLYIWGAQIDDGAAPLSYTPVP